MRRSAERSKQSVDRQDGGISVEGVAIGSHAEFLACTYGARYPLQFHLRATKSHIGVYVEIREPPVYRAVRHCVFHVLNVQERQEMSPSSLSSLHHMFCIDGSLNVLTPSSELWDGACSASPREVASALGASPRKPYDTK